MKQKLIMLGLVVFGFAMFGGTLVGSMYLANAATNAFKHSMGIQK